MTINEAVSVFERFVCNYSEEQFLAWQTLKAAVLAQQSTNKQMLQLPAWDKCMVEGCNETAVMLGGNGRFCMRHG